MVRRIDLRVDLIEAAGSITVVGSLRDHRGSGPAIDPSLLPRLRRRARQVAAKRLPWPDLLAFGQQLGSLLFAGGVRDLLVDGLSALADDERLHIRLCLHDRDIASLPWELAYVPSLDSDVRLGPYLALDERVVFTRRLAGDPPPWAASPASRSTSTPSSPFRTVVAPATVVGGGIASLQRSEPLVIQRALDGSAAHDCVVLDDPVSVRSLDDALATGCDLFHFTGHGVAGTGLVLSAEDGGADVLALRRLASLLAGAQTRLAVLNACDTGTVGPSDIVGGTMGSVESLLAAGVPAVVAMQHPIEDSHGITFARVFYEALARGEAVDVAVGRSRQALCRLGLSSEWAVPVLYLGDEPPFPERAERSSGGEGAPDRRVRFRIPPVVPGFTGRDEELRAMGAGSREAPVGVRCQFLSGMGGVGKTQLAAAYVSDRAEVFDIVAWIRAEHGPSADLAALG